jgi:putative Flp pilus-assembly TadE/G-like protein
VTRPGADPRGQVLIISAFALIVLMAIGAIVVDLGMSWLLHRKEQNAADPASVAAAHWIPGNPGGGQTAMEGEACFYAQKNGFFLGDPGCAAALGSGSLEVNSPPATTRAGNFQGRPGFVEVVIHDTHPSFFGQLFGRPFAEVVTAAVAANTEGNSNSSSLVALGGSCTPPDDGDSSISGGGTIFIHPAAGVSSPGGYVNVNAPCGAIRNPGACDGNGNASALGITGGATLTAPHVFVVGACGQGGGGQLRCYPAGSPPSTPCLDEQDIPLGDPLAGLEEPWPFLQGSLPVPACPKASEINSPSDPNPCTLSKTGGANAPCPTGVCTMSPGVYYAGWDIKSGVQVVMKPGMYVFAGFGIQTVAGAELSAIADVAADGITPIDARVTIFSTDYTPGCQAGQPKFCQGSININSNGPLILKATTLGTCALVSPTICPWKGILLWQDGSVVNTAKDVSITGQADLVLAGTIYAPKSDVSITGGANSTGCNDAVDPICLAVQIVSRQWKVAGQGVMDMPYDPSELYQLEQQGLVH